MTVTAQNAKEIIQWLQGCSSTERVLGASYLATFASCSPRNQLLLCQEGALQPLGEMLRDGDEAERQAAANVIKRIAEQVCPRARLCTRVRTRLHGCLSAEPRVPGPSPHREARPRVDQRRSSRSMG